MGRAASASASGARRRALAVHVAHRVRSRQVRYRLPDLLRLLARERLLEEEPEDRRSAARDRYVRAAPAQAIPRYARRMPSCSSSAAARSASTIRPVWST